MTAQVRARQNECSQTLWLFGDSNIVTEAGASNFFVIWRRSDNKALELVTCSDETGVILNGITRRSVLEIARERLGSQDAAKQVSGDLEALDVIERPFSIGEVVKAHQEGRLIEAFVSGTAVSTYMENATYNSRGERLIVLLDVHLTRVPDHS
jgi:branched-chain amino acid aminotransferase